MRHSRLFVGLLIALSFSLAGRDASAVYGGSTSGSYKYQQESREDDYAGFSCASYNNACFGRCGPGCSTTFGTKVTTACQNHDACIRDYVCSGYSKASAYYNCLTGSRGLNHAAKSMVQYHFNNAVQYVKSAAQSVWAWVS